MSLDLAQNIRRHGFKRLLLAVSGGLDSICLAHYFIANREALGIEWLGIAHVHHGLREGTADRDAAFVEEFALQYNVPFFLKHLDGDALKETEGSLEENARDARYKALVEIALDPSASPQDDTLHTAHPAPHTSYLKGSEATDPIPHTSIAIVTAHHAGDLAETMYMRLRRGTTLAGFRGIQEVRVLDEASHTPKQPKVATPYLKGSEATDPTPHTPSLYRPFLSVSREELLAYARENSLKWCEDESNDDLKFARNKVRHETLPRLEQECPGATEQLCRMAEIADRAYAKVMEKCGNLFEGACTRVMDPLRCAPGMTKSISLNNKTLRKVLLEHANADLSEMFRLWLSEQGLRFPIGFFYGESEPAHVKIPHRAAYRRRSIAKIGHTVQICEFLPPKKPRNLYLAERKIKDYNESAQEASYALQE